MTSFSGKEYSKSSRPLGTPKLTRVNISLLRILLKLCIVRVWKDSSKGCCQLSLIVIEHDRRRQKDRRSNKSSNLRNISRNPFSLSCLQYFVTISSSISSNFRCTVLMVWRDYGDTKVNRVDIWIHIVYQATVVFCDNFYLFLPLQSHL